ncbi:MAG: signal transduction histidine kinase [Candidatus Pelagisphaera sp.]|jgi:signal transduction histidine kinase
MKSLTSRITIWYALATTITGAGFMFFGGFLVESNYIDGVDFLNDMEFEDIRPLIEAFVEQERDEAVLAAIDAHTKMDARLFFFQIGQSHDDALFISDNLGGVELPHVVYGSRRTTILDLELGRIRVGEYQVGGYSIYIASSLQNLLALERNLLRVSAIGLMAIFLLSVAVGYFLSRIALKPISKIQETASRISAKNLGDRIEVSNTGDEVYRLATFLNSMFDRLEGSFDQVQRFTADASHELKTPLSLIRLTAEELIVKGSMKTPECVTALEYQVELVDSVNKIVDDLLILAKADSGVLKLSYKEQSAKLLLEDFAQDASALCEDKGLLFSIENNYDGCVRCDPVWLRHLLFNLFSNAMRFSSRNGRIELVSTVEANDWVIVLKDEGPGVPEEKLDRIFERFFHDDGANETIGSGLGLPLCRSIAQLHKGTLEIVNRDDRSGAVAILHLPLDFDV